jgi:hypothetical protein
VIQEFSDTFLSIFVNMIVDLSQNYEFRFDTPEFLSKNGQKTPKSGKSL